MKPLFYTQFVGSLGKPVVTDFLFRVEGRQFLPLGKAYTHTLHTTRGVGKDVGGEGMENDVEARLGFALPNVIGKYLIKKEGVTETLAFKESSATS